MRLGLDGSPSVAPLAQLCADHVFSSLRVLAASRRDLLRMFLAAESGAHTSHAAVELYWATEATIEPMDGPSGRGHIAIDGELMEPATIDVRCEPSAVRAAVVRASNE